MIEETTTLPLRSCLLCGGCLAPLHRFADRTVAYCDRCELGQLEPCPTVDEIARLYSSAEYFEGTDRVGYAGYAGDAEQFARTFEVKVRGLLRHARVQRLLEVGCGPGYFLSAASKAGVEEAIGVDLNPVAVEAARGAGCLAEVGTIAEIPAVRRFDAVVMFDVIEHIPEPEPFLADVRARLLPGGVLFLMTPNIRSLLARVSGRRWVSYKIPEHILYYSPRSMRLLLERAGFDVLSIRPTGQYVTFDFLLSRIARLVPSVARLRPVVGAFGLGGRVLFVPNGSIDVVARLERSD